MSFLFKALKFHLQVATQNLFCARCGATAREWFADASCYNGKVIRALRRNLRRTARKAVLAASRAYVLVSVIILRSHYQLPLFAL